MDEGSELSVTKNQDNPIHPHILGLPHVWLKISPITMKSDDGVNKSLTLSDIIQEKWVNHHLQYQG